MTESAELAPRAPPAETVESSVGRDLGNHQELLEAVWRERANRLSQRPNLTEEKEKGVQVIVVGLGNERYGIELSDVAEVLPAIQATQVPGAAAVFAGVINVHGEIRAVIDLRRLLGIDSTQAGGLARVILLRRKGNEMGLGIDSVEEVRWISSSELQSAGDGSAGSSHYIKGSTKDHLMLLRTEALFEELHAGVTT